jgi:hypothetical protein
MYREEQKNLRGATNLESNLVKEDSGDLLAHFHNIVNKQRTDPLSYWLYTWSVMLVRNKYSWAINTTYSCCFWG